MWHPSEEKTNPRAGNEMWLLYANADKTFNSESDKIILS